MAPSSDSGTAVPSPAEAAEDAMWTINSAHKSGSPKESQGFGARQASTTKVRLAEQAARLLLGRISPRRLAVSAPIRRRPRHADQHRLFTGRLIEQSRLIVRHIAVWRIRPRRRICSRLTRKFFPSSADPSGSPAVRRR